MRFKMRGKYKRRREARRREAPPQDNVTPHPTTDTLKFIAETAALMILLVVFLVGFLLLAPPY